MRNFRGHEIWAIIMIWLYAISSSLLCHCMLCYTLAGQHGGEASSPVSDNVDSLDTPGSCQLDHTLPHATVGSILNHTVTWQNINKIVQLWWLGHANSYGCSQPTLAKENFISNISTHYTAVIPQSPVVFLYLSWVFVTPLISLMMTAV